MSSMMRAERRSDRGDVEIIAHYVRKQVRLRLLPYSTETRAPRVVVRRRSDHIQQRVAAANRLERSLRRSGPAPRALLLTSGAPITSTSSRRYPELSRSVRKRGLNPVSWTCLLQARGERLHAS